MAQASTSGFGGAGCSGAFIGPRYVLTAGHCVDDDDVLANPQGIIQAGASGNTFQFSYAGPLSGILYFGNGLGSDIAMIILPKTSVSQSPFWLGLEAMAAAKVGEGVRLYGYPNAGDICWTTLTNPALPPGVFRPNYPLCGTANNRHLYYDTCQITGFYFGDTIFSPCDSTDGQSGGPMLRTKTGNKYVIAVNKGSGKLTAVGPYIWDIYTTMLNFPPTSNFTYVLGQPSLP